MVLGKIWVANMKCPFSNFFFEVLETLGGRTQLKRVDHWVFLVPGCPLHPLSFLLNPAEPSNHELYTSFFSLLFLCQIFDHRNEVTCPVSKSQI